MYSTVADLFREQAQPGDTTPFFLYFHSMRPHPPYFGNEYTGTFLPREDGMANMQSQNPLIHKPYDQYNPTNQLAIEKLRLRYDESILKADQELGQLIDTLKQLGLYDDSMIIITADHGTSFTGGFQGYFSPAVLAAEHHIPLLVKFPGQAQERRVDSAVSLVDILPTVLETVGVTYPSSWTDGQSLLTADQRPKRVVYVTRLGGVATLDFERVAAIQGNMKLVRRKDREFLFNLEDDPDEKLNLLGQQSVPGLYYALNQFSRRTTLLQTGRDITRIILPADTGMSGGTDTSRQRLLVPQ
jgi:arylsulfatase A-like enzyme